MLKDFRFTDYFLFTQHSLATFDNCPLKFKKRYMEGLKWDSFPDEKIKKRLEMGNNFHLLANRYFMGIDTGLDEAAEEFNDLNKWLESLKKNFRMEQDALYLPEYKLRMISPKLKLEANFDLLIVKENAIEIWDWKTHGEKSNSKRLLESKRLIESLQTTVYMFVLKEQVKLITGKKIECQNISMNYWQPEPARIVAYIDYNDEMHESFRAALERKTSNIFEYDYSSFDKELYRKHCKYCEFNWFCNNEQVNFDTVEEEDDFLEDLDWDAIEEKY